MNASPASRPTRFLAANAANFAIAFLVGFLVFAAGVFFSVHDGQRVAPINRSSGPASPLAAAPNLPFTPVRAITLPPIELQLPATSPLPYAAGKRRKPAKAEPSPVAQPASPAPSKAMDTAERSDPAPAKPEPSVERKPLTIPADTVVHVRIGEPLSTLANGSDDNFQGLLAAPIRVDGTVVAAAGSAVSGRIVGAKRAGLFRGRSVLSLELTGITAPDGKRLAIKTNQWFRTGEHNRLAGGKRSEITLPAGAEASFRLLAPVAAP